MAAFCWLLGDREFAPLSMAAPKVFLFSLPLTNGPTDHHYYYYYYVLLVMFGCGLCSFMGFKSVAMCTFCNIGREAI